MSVVPQRRVREWTTVPGTRTTYGAPAPVLVHRGWRDAGNASVWMSYPTADITSADARAVRLDFRWVVQLTFTSFWADDEGPTDEPDLSDNLFALNVRDGSQTVETFAKGYHDNEGWRPVFGDRRPEDILRHFQIAFDDFGFYDVLAADCVVREFTLSAATRAATTEGDREEALVADAVALGPVTPIVAYPET